MRRSALVSLQQSVCGAALTLVLASAASAQTTAATAPVSAPAASTEATVPAASAQAEPATGNQATSGEIVVTGTRIATGFVTPTPVTVLTSQRSKSLVITNVGDALNQLPAFRPSVNPATQANAGGNIGARLLDLRGLNPQRTLVLVDGHRFVPSTSTGSVDVNLIPSALVDRTDIVTGGASAAYGSDAVAGVVNFVLNHKLSGITVEATGGISQRGDNSDQYISVSGGTKIGDRLHLIFAAEYENNGGLGDCNSRSWCENVNSIVANPAVGKNGLPANFIVLGGARVASLSPGGLINGSVNAAGKPIYPTITDPTAGNSSPADPLRGLTFNPDGSTRQFQYGSYVGSLYMIGGEGANRNPFVEPFLLTPPVRRYVGYTSLQADLTDTITGTVDLSYGRVEGRLIANVFRDYNGSIIGPIKSGNPYIPASIQAVMTQNNIAGFILGRAGFDLGPATAKSVTQTYRAVANLKGSLGGHWKWDLSYEYGRTDLHQQAYNSVNVANIRNAVDAVVNPANGQIVCRSTLTNPTDGCVPINLFGEGRFSPAAKAYVVGNPFQTTRNEQQNVTGNISGDLITLPAGPLSIAAGAEYRRDTISGDADAVSRTNGYFQLNGSAIAAGHVDVKEVYGEAELPILKESVVGYALNLNGAIRRTDYSTSGAVTTWKFGGVYQPIQAIRLRATKSRDIRAPNLNELRGPTVKTTATLTDPLRPGQNINPTVFTGSNPNLSPEKADSFTAGIVLAPTGGFLRRMRVSVDYYDIKVKNVIANIGAQSIATGCAAGNQTLCALITRDTATIDPVTGATVPGVITQVQDITLNSARLKTRGFDIEYQYRQPLGALGALAFQMLANITSDLITPDGVNRAGQTGFRATTVPGAPDYTLDGLLTWTHGNFSLTGHGHYIPHGIYSVNFLDPSQSGYAPILPSTGIYQSVNNNKVPSRIYFDLAANLSLAPVHGHSMDIFGSITNLLDKSPPPSPSNTGGTNQILFDPIGRSFKIGVRVHL
jgi:outer membrane receptor protein involved in Fe transport